MNDKNILNISKIDDRASYEVRAWPEPVGVGEFQREFLSSIGTLNAEGTGPTSDSKESAVVESDISLSLNERSGAQVNGFIDRTEGSLPTEEDIRALEGIPEADEAEATGSVAGDEASGKREKSSVDLIGEEVQNSQRPIGRGDNAGETARESQGAGLTEKPSENGSNEDAKLYAAEGFNPAPGAGKEQAIIKTNEKGYTGTDVSTENTNGKGNVSVPQEGAFAMNGETPSRETLKSEALISNIFTRGQANNDAINNNGTALAPEIKAYITSPDPDAAQSTDNTVMATAAVESAGLAGNATFINLIVRQISDKAAVIFKNNDGKATITLNPPELEKLKVEISMENNQAKATITTENVVVGEALEANLLLLSEALEARGLAVDDLNIIPGGGSFAYGDKVEGLILNSPEEGTDAGESKEMNSGVPERGKSAQAFGFAAKGSESFPAAITTSKEGAALMSDASVRGQANKDLVLAAVNNNRSEPARENGAKTASDTAPLDAGTGKGEFSIPQDETLEMDGEMPSKGALKGEPLMPDASVRARTNKGPVLGAINNNRSASARESAADTASLDAGTGKGEFSIPQEETLEMDGEMPSKGALKGEALMPDASVLGRANEGPVLGAINSNRSELVRESGMEIITPGTGITQATVDVTTPNAVKSGPPVRNTAFDNVLVAQVSSKMAVTFKNNLSKATLILNPPELGKLKVKIVMENSKVKATIATENVFVRDALEANLPLLREALQAQGLTVNSLDIMLDNASIGGDGRRWSGSSKREGSFRGKDDSLEDNATGIQNISGDSLDIFI